MTSGRKQQRLIAREKKHKEYHKAGLNGNRAVARRLRQAAKRKRSVAISN